jgi:hypothetical protein
MIRRIVGAVIFIFLGALGGIVLGAEAMDAAYGGVNVRWQDVSLPDGHIPAFFTTGEGPYALVMTTGGDIFAHLINPDKLYVWQLVDDSPLAGDPFYTNATAECKHIEPAITERWMQDPPGVIREQISCHYMRHAEYTAEIRYVLQEDQSIWRWRKVDPGLAGLGIFVYYSGRGILGGGALGLLAYIFLLTAIRVMRKDVVEDLPTGEVLVFTINTDGSPQEAPRQEREKGFLDRLSSMEKILILVVMLMVFGLVFWLIFSPFLSLIF